MILIRRCCVCKTEMGRSVQPGAEEMAYTDGYCRRDMLRVLVETGLATPEESAEWEQVR